MRRLWRFIAVLLLVSLCQPLITYVYPRESGIFAYFIVQTCFASDPDANSGSNVKPSGATTITQAKDSRWVIYDRGDKTDWLKVSPPRSENQHLIICFNFLQVEGEVVVEVYKDPSADFLEKRVIERVGIYEYIPQTIEDYYIKLYAVDQGSLAHYEFSYTLTSLPTSTSISTPMSTPVLTTTLTITPTPIPRPIPAITPIPTITPTPTPTEVPTATSTPAQSLTVTVASIPAITQTLSESDFEVIGDRYGVPFNLLRAIVIIESQEGRVPGSFEVSKIVDSTQLKFLRKIAQHTGRSISDFKGSSTGTMGYMQFMPATFYYYAQDGNGDGIKDPLNPYDSLATAAYFLAQEIAKKKGIQAALKSYNNSPASYEKILQLYWKLEADNKRTSR